MSSVFLASSFVSWIYNFVEMNVFKTLQRLEAPARKVLWEIDVPKMSENIERLQIRAKFLENI